MTDSSKNILFCPHRKNFNFCLFLLSKKVYFKTIYFYNTSNFLSFLINHSFFIYKINTLSLLPLYYWLCLPWDWTFQLFWKTWTSENSDMDTIRRCRLRCLLRDYITQEIHQQSLLLTNDVRDQHKINFINLVIRDTHNISAIEMEDIVFLVNTYFDEHQQLQQNFGIELMKDISVDPDYLPYFPWMNY